MMNYAMASLFGYLWLLAVGVLVGFNAYHVRRTEGRRMSSWLWLGSSLGIFAASTVQYAAGMVP